MNWIAKDIDTYLQQKEYIDTLIVPLLKLGTGVGSLKNSASSSEFLMHLTTLIETQFKGRLMLMPPIAYTESTNLEAMAVVLAKDLESMDFKHVIYVTTDSAWTSIEKLDVIWLPSIPLEDMDVQLKQKILEDQLRQVLPRLTAKWTAL